MKVVYASRTGNVEKFVNKLGITDLLKIPRNELLGQIGITF